MQLTGFERKVFVVTGGGSGIGRQVALDLATAGASVAIADLNGEAARVVAQEITAAGGDARDWRLDVAEETAVGEFVESVESELGPIAGLVNAAGTIGTGLRAVDLTLAEWERTYAVNVRGVFLCSTEVARRMVPRAAGNIVTVASLTTQVLRMGQSAYASSKVATSYFTRALGLELAEHGIRCNVVHPGVTDTPMARKYWTDPARREQQITGDLSRFRVGIALGKLATSADVSNSILFLLSDQASHVTATDLLVDGGSTLAY